MVVNHVKMEDEDQLDVEFWQAKTASERIFTTPSASQNLSANIRPTDDLLLLPP